MDKGLMGLNLLGFVKSILRKCKCIECFPTAVCDTGRIKSLSVINDKIISYFVLKQEYFIINNQINISTLVTARKG